jgi:hypothetical protein
MKFNETKFLENVQKIHLKPEEILIYSGIPDAEVREKLNKFVDYGSNPRFSRALDEICENLVGRTMFKLLITKMISNDTLKDRGKMRIMEQDNKRKGSEYSHQQFAVKINFDFYDDNNIGKQERQYYCLNDCDEIETKLKSIAGSVFHEFCHGLHHVSGNHISHKRNILCIEKTLFADVWGADEELRTITCFNQDPICDHCFDFCQSILKREVFRPRYGHDMGYRDGYSIKDTENRKKLLQNLPVSQNYMDGWKKYMIP